MTDKEPLRAGRRVTLVQVAKAAGVSTALASIVMRGVPGASDANRALVWQTATDLGYRPDPRARLLRQQRSRLLGVTFGLEQPFHGDVVGSIYRAADAAGYEVVLSGVTPTRTEVRAAETLLTDRCEALILVGSTATPAQLASWRAQRPVVLIARRLRRQVVDTIHTADSTGLGLAVDHLVGLGHRRIAHVDGAAAPGSADRRHGYRAAMSRYGMSDQIQIVPGGLTEEDGSRAVESLLAHDLPTAIIAFNDRCAMGILRSLKDHDISVPAQVSVVGYDNSRLSWPAWLDLTTVAQDVKALGRIAVERSIALIEGDTSSKDHEVAPRLILRSTTAPAARP